MPLLVLVLVKDKVPEPSFVSAVEPINAPAKLLLLLASMVRLLKLDAFDANDKAPAPDTTLRVVPAVRVPLVKA